MTHRTKARRISTARPPLSRMPETSALRRCLERIDRPRRDVVVLAYVHGMSHGELAGRLKVPLGTVKSWVRRSLFCVAGVHGMSLHDDSIRRRHGRRLRDGPAGRRGARRRRSSASQPTMPVSPAPSARGANGLRISMPRPRKLAPSAGAVAAHRRDAPRPTPIDRRCPARAPRCAAPRCGTTSGSGAAPASAARSPRCCSR